MQAAALAGFGVLARIDLGAAGEKIFGELLDAVAPVDQLLGGERVLDQGAGAFESSASSVALASPTRPAKASSPGAHLGKDQAAELFVFVQGEAGVERQLHIVGAGQVPGFGRDVAGFVVDDQQRTVVEPVDAVQAQIESEAGDVNGAVDLGSCYFKLDAGGFVVQPFGTSRR